MQINDSIPYVGHTLPTITAYERRALHMGVDPATIYQGEDLDLYLAIKAKEEEDETQR